MWKLVCFVAILAALNLVKCDQIYVRSHGEKASETEPVIAEKTFETVLGLKVSPKRRLRVRTRVPKKDPTTTEAIQAAKAAALVAKDLHQQPQKNPSYRDLEPIESSHVPVSYSSQAQ